MPAVIHLIVISSLYTAMEFYGKLLAPRIAYYDESLKDVRYLLNGNLLLWIPFCISACAIIRLATIVRAWPRSEPREGKGT